MTLEELLNEIANTDKRENYEILLKKLKPGFTYEYLPLKIEKINDELETIILKIEHFK